MIFCWLEEVYHTCYDPLMPFLLKEIWQLIINVFEYIFEVNIASFTNSILFRRLLFFNKIFWSLKIFSFCRVQTFYIWHYPLLFKLHMLVASLGKYILKWNTHLALSVNVRTWRVSCKFWKYIYCSEIHGKVKMQM